MDRVTLKFKMLDPDAIIPKYQTEGAACFDIHAFLKEDVVLKPQEHAIIPTGLAVAIPSGYEIQIRPRSGLAAKHCITVVNSPGTIDSDYRGELKIIVQNNVMDTYMRSVIGYESMGERKYTIKNRDRIAQCKVAIVPIVDIVVVDDLDETDRGEGGFGSTGG